MDKSRKYCAIDLGGSHGRAIVGSFNGERLTITQADSFAYVPVIYDGILKWDVHRIFSMVKEGLGRASKKAGSTLDSVSIDTMGSNFALLGGDGRLLELPPYMRIKQNKRVHDYIFSIIAPQAIYRTTGLQLKKLNTLYHLVQASMEGSLVIEKAQTFLMLSDLFNYWLTGEKVCEMTIASTTHLMNARKRDWAYDLIEKFKIKKGIFPQIVQTGTCLGKIKKELCYEIGQPNLHVVAGASHDTAAAVVCTSQEEGGYISLGTWGMLGCLKHEPILSEKAMDLGFANEGAAYGDIRFIFNSLGMYLLKKCIDIWNATSVEKVTFDELNNAVQFAKPFRSLINPRDERFLALDNMVQEIVQFCIDTNQPVPKTKGEIVRCIFESLALNFKDIFQKMIELTGNHYPQIHVMGGASQNRIFMQYLANALNRSVVAGPAEAAAIGNILVQMRQNGDISDMEEGRKVVERSFPYTYYKPANTALWDNVFGRFKELIH